MDNDLLEKLEIAHDWLGHHKGQPCTASTLINNWAFCGEILEQIIGEEYERRYTNKKMEPCPFCGKKPRYLFGAILCECGILKTKRYRWGAIQERYSSEKVAIKAWNRRVKDGQKSTG